MLQRTCNICGRQATIHETLVSDGQAARRHFCPDHGKSELPSLPTVSREIQATLENLERNSVEAYRRSFEAYQESLALLDELISRARGT